MTMGASTIILIIIAAALIAVGVAVYVAPHRRGVDIQMDDRTSIKLSQGGKGRLRIEFVASDEPGWPSDAELVPDVPNDVLSPSPFTRDFIRRLAAIDDAPAAEREELIAVLQAKRLITEDEAKKWLFEHEDGKDATQSERDTDAQDGAVRDPKEKVAETARDPEYPEDGGRPDAFDPSRDEYDEDDFGRF